MFVTAPFLRTAPFMVTTAPGDTLTTAYATRITALSDRVTHKQQHLPQ